MLASKTTEQLPQIVAAGGGLDFVASKKTTPQLVQIASMAARTGVRVTFRGMAAKTTPQMVQIAAAGNGHVIFGD